MRKSIKMFVLAVITIFTGLILVGCSDDSSILEDTYNNFKIEDIFNYDDTKNSVTKDLTFIDEIGDVKIVWSSDNLDVISVDGKVTRSTEVDVLVVITAKLSYKEEEKIRNIEVIVIKIEEKKEEEENKDPKPSEPVASTATASYSGEPSKFSDNDEENHASLVGLDQSIFIVTGTVHKPEEPTYQTTPIGLREDTIRIYSTGIGNTLSIAVRTGYVITGLEINFSYDTNYAKNAPAEAVLSLDNVEETLSANELINTNVLMDELSITGFSLHNNKTGQIWISSIIINYETVVATETLHTVSYDLNYETTLTIPSIKVAEGIELFGELITPHREGYIFLGWYLYDMLYTNIPIYEDVTLLAQWGEDTSNQTTYTENFSNMVEYRRYNGEYTQSEYAPLGQLKENNNILWEYGYFRTDVGMSKYSPQSITIKGSGDGTAGGRGWVTGFDINDGISYIEFDARLPFSPLSSYPQVNGRDEASNVYITVIIEQNGEVVYTSRIKDNQTLDKENRQFESDRQANKGKKFILSDIKIKGQFDLSIEVSSGHRATIANLLWKDNKGSYDDLPVDNKQLIHRLDFDHLEIDQYNTSDEIININGKDFVTKEMWANNKNIHGDKESPYMTKANGTGVARLRGNSTRPFSTPTAYLYNNDYIDELTSIKFDARKFGDENYEGIGKLRIYYQTLGSEEWLLLGFKETLSLDFTTYELDINKTGVKIKFEASDGTINIDNIEFYK